MEGVLKTIEENGKKALDINSSVWVAASAGSGKTTILVNRLLSLLVNDVDISKVICITYTKTAAHEMKERIYEELAKWVKLNDESLVKEVKKNTNLKSVGKNFLKKARTLFSRVIDNIDDLKIFTIHSFCQQIISRFPIEAGILPNFEVIEDFKVNELIDEAKDEVFSSVGENNILYSYVKNLIEDNSENDFNKLINCLISNRKDFELIQDKDYESDLKELLNVRYINTKDLEDEFLNYNYSEIIKLAEIIESGKFTDCEKEQFGGIGSFLRQVNEEYSSKSIFDYLNIFLTKQLEKRKLNGILKKLDDYYIDVLLNECERCFNFVQNYENIKVYNYTVAVINIAFKIIENYKKLKNKNSYLDFDDLIIIALRLLENTEYSAWVNYKLDNGIEHILVDEAQDTSSLQWRIIRNLSGDFFSGETKNENERTLFVVGDEKQSIFSFQGANPKMFDENRIFYKEIIENSRKFFTEVSLRYSFRSLGNILQFVDTVFKDEAYIKKISNKDKNIIHKNVRDGVGLVELWPKLSVKKKEKDNWDIDFDSTEEAKKLELLAECIGSKIKYLIESDRVILDRKTKKFRRIKAGDIMVLFKKRDEIFLSYFTKYLNENNIANSGYDRLDLFKDIIIEDFIALFNFVIFQEDDLNLANIMKSPFLELKEDDLYELCRYKIDNEVSLFSAMKSNKKYKKQCDFLFDIIEKSKILSIYDLYFYLLENCGIRIRILERFGKNANEILNGFFDFIKSYEKNNNTATLLSFLYFINNNENIIKKELNDKDQVKIMTIHNSKGMQSPIVFVANCNVKIREGQDDSLFWSAKEEYKIPIYKKGTTSKVVADIKQNFGYEEHSEYFRLFYVAMTRAENELYLCSCGDEKSSEDEDGKEEKKHTWYDLSKDAMLDLEAKEVKFDFSEGEKKFVFGEETFISDITFDIDKNVDLKDKNENECENNIEKQQLLNDLLKYRVEEQAERVISPSQFYSHTDKDNLYTKLNDNIVRGNAVHKLLEILPDVKVKDREKLADICLAKSFSKLSLADRNEIKDIVIDILENEKFKKFFIENSKGEVEIVGKILEDGEELMVSGKIDRMVETKDKILILDYKNTAKHYESCTELPKSYLKQLELYKKLVERIYKDKVVECYILITTWGELIRVF